jgi:hypothetical protein
MGAASAGGKRRYRKIKVFLFDLPAWALRYLITTVLGEENHSKSLCAGLSRASTSSFAALVRALGE